MHTHTHTYTHTETYTRMHTHINTHTEEAISRLMRMACSKWKSETNSTLCINKCPLLSRKLLFHLSLIHVPTIDFAILALGLFTCFGIWVDRFIFHEIHFLSFSFSLSPVLTPLCLTAPPGPLSRSSSKKDNPKPLLPAVLGWGCGQPSQKVSGHLSSANRD